LEYAGSDTRSTGRSHGVMRSMQLRLWLKALKK